MEEQAVEKTTHIGERREEKTEWTEVEGVSGMQNFDNGASFVQKRCSFL